MKTQRRILLVVIGSLVEFGALVTLLAGPLGVLRSFLIALAAVAVANVVYLVFIRPWQTHWGATGGEAARPMPGDDIAGPGARCTTRAVTIQAPASHVWPWLTQPGYGRAGWYSYDWRGNGGQPGIGQIEPEWQQVGPRDPVRMMPGSAFDVVQVEDGHYFVVRAPDQTMFLVPGSRAAGSAQLPADQPVARQVVRRPGQCPVDRAVRPRLLQHGAPDATQDQGASGARGAAWTRPTLSGRAVNPPTRPSSLLPLAATAGRRHRDSWYRRPAAICGPGAERQVSDRELWPATCHPQRRSGHPVRRGCAAPGGGPGTCSAGRGWPDHRVPAVCARCFSPARCCAARPASPAGV